MFSLNKCKKCGESEDFTIYADGATPDDGYRLVICGGCRTETGWGRNELEAKEIWNASNKLRGRPSTNFDKRAYQREYMRRRRAKAKAEKEARND